MKREEFKNFGNTQNRANIIAARPRNLAEIKATLQFARGGNLTVRAAGNAHSWAPLFADEEQIIMYMGDVTYDDRCQSRISINKDVIHFIIQNQLNISSFIEFK